MLCRHCGSTYAPGAERCGVCHTPTPPPSGQARGPTVSSVGSGAELTQPSGATATQGTPGPTSGTSQVLQSGQQFGGRYVIIRLLGSGGMATVYQAWDETLSTAVALKLIRVDAGTSAEDLHLLEERFKRELKLARQVTHPNVVRIHDLGEQGSTLYLTMEYVQGMDLATLLRREPALTLPRALSLARQIAAGLAAAHRAGIVHRDLKPSNVMVAAEGHALLMDFGIARSTSGATGHTSRGAIIGTLDYMAPEQARGEPADARTDVYAFGLILFELLAGRRPAYSDEGGLPTLLARLDKGLPPLRSLRPDVPPPLERIVDKCLAANPGSRYPSANELLADLEAIDQAGRPLTTARSRRAWVSIAALVLAGTMIVAGTWWLASRRPRVTPAATRGALPVLIVDFDNRSGDAVFDGVLEQALSIAMEGAPFITVFPRRDAAGLVRDLKLGPKLDESAGRLVGKREGLAVILAGSFDRSGSGYSIEVRAISPDKVEPITIARTTAADKTQVLAALGRVAEDVREALGDDTLGAAPAETFTATSLEAVSAYTTAQDLSRNQKEAEAVSKYLEALRHDPDFGRALSGLAASLLRLGRREEAQKYWEEALRRTDRMTEREKLRTYGSYYLGVARNYDKAIETYEELVRKYPSDSAGYNNLALTHFYQLNFAKALEYGRKAIAIYPKTYKYRSNLALYAMYAGDFSTAVREARVLIQEDPQVDVPYLALAMANLMSGDSAGGRAAFEQAATAGDVAASLSAIGLADLAMAEGRHADAIASLPVAVTRDEAHGNTTGASFKLVALTEAYAARGESPRAQAAIARARRLSDDDNVLVPAARLAIAEGRLEDARTIAADLSARLPAQSRAYARLIEGQLAMHNREYPVAIDAFNAARKLADLWLVRFSLGLAYFHRGDYPEALSEFEKCQARRGEATAIFLDDVPTFRYYATLPYWLGRAREMQKLDARPQFQEFLRIRSGATGDPLVEDARKRLDVRTP